MPEDEVYNPLDYHNLTVNLVRELMERGPFTLPPTEPFRGAGVYALFYHGDHPAYASISSDTAEQPIYVGKAVPAGARRGQRGGDTSLGRELFNRLRQHAGSIEAVENLNLDHFLCRYLVVTPLWITMAERFLIEHYQPAWNVTLDGFGLHNPGRYRATGEIPWWDAMHPGRPWAAQLRRTPEREQVEARVAAFFDLQRADPDEARRLAEAAADAATQTDT